MDENDKGITNELIQYILQNVCLMLDIIKPEELEEPTNEYLTEKLNYDKKINLITLYITMICNNIIIKTNRKVFPKELKYVVINLVVDKFNSNIPDSDIQSIQSITEYDRSVNFGVPSVLQTKLNMIAQKQLDENEKLINRYKLLYRVDLKPKEVGDNNEQG